MTTRPKPSDVKPPSRGERIYTHTELNLILKRKTSELKEQVQYLNKVVSQLQEALDDS